MVRRIKALVRKVESLLWWRGTRIVWPDGMGGVKVVTSLVDLRRQILAMPTYLGKSLPGDAGNPNECLTFAAHGLYTQDRALEDIKKRCEMGSIGCFTCKKALYNNFVTLVVPTDEDSLGPWK